MIGTPSLLFVSLSIMLGIAAQNEQGEPVQSITIEGLSRDAARERAENFLRTTGVAAGGTAAARWVEPVCPKISGLSLPQAEGVLERVRSVAVEAGIPLAGSRCRPNIMISFVSDGAALVREISGRSSRALDEVPVSRRDELRNGTQPIRWWYRTELVGKDERSGTAGTPVALMGDWGNVPTSGETGSLSQYDSSLTSTQAKRVLRSATVIVDAAKAKGYPLDALAAYAAMVAFAEMKFASAPEGGTILALFAPGSTVRDLSEQDRAFLSGLYRIRLDRGARHHRNALIRAMLNPGETEEQ